ncbi:hypothetical protein V1478_006694 [Vespula squamosa]|uniref:Secreted protein n=1 Tax=Vespula squamosa TaxID=30214 RepID=A0ABD2B0P0_VESSQ
MAFDTGQRLMQASRFCSLLLTVECGLRLFFIPIDNRMEEIRHPDFRHQFYLSTIEKSIRQTSTKIRHSRRDFIGYR